MAAEEGFSFPSWLKPYQIPFRYGAHRRLRHPLLIPPNSREVIDESDSESGESRGILCMFHQHRRFLATERGNEEMDMLWEHFNDNLRDEASEDHSVADLNYRIEIGCEEDIRVSEQNAAIVASKSRPRLVELFKVWKKYFLPPQHS